MGNVLNYGDYDEETAQQEKDDLASGGADFMKLVVGRNLLRILPPPPGKRTPFRVAYQHFIEVGGNSQSVICARLEAKQPCGVCMKIDQLRKSKEKVDQDMASAFFARRRVFVNVFDRNEPDETKRMKVLAFGKSIHEQLTALRTDEVAGADYVNPEKGFDVVIERTGTGKNDTKYKVFLARKSTPLADSIPKMQELIDTQRNLDGYAKLKSADEIKQLLSGEEADEAAPAARPGRTPGPGATASKRRTAEDDAIDVDGEEV